MKMNKILLYSASVLGLGLGFLGLSQDASAAEITVQSGDTLSKIAQTHNTTVDSLVAINGIANPNLIFVGEVLQTEGTNVATVQETQTYVEPTQTYVEPTQTYTEPVQETQTTTVSQSGDNWNKANRRMVESTNNYQWEWGNGYYGAYQFAPSTWNSIASQAGLDPNDHSPANQDAMADAYANSRYGGWQNVPTSGGW